MLIDNQYKKLKQLNGEKKSLMSDNIMLLDTFRKSFELRNTFSVERFIEYSRFDLFIKDLKKINDEKAIFISNLNINIQKRERLTEQIIILENDIIAKEQELESGINIYIARYIYICIVGHAISQSESKNKYRQ